jgi:hypothetical protein
MVLEIVILSDAVEVVVGWSHLSFVNWKRVIVLRELLERRHFEGTRRWIFVWIRLLISGWQDVHIHIRASKFEVRLRLAVAVMRVSPTSTYWLPIHGMPRSQAKAILLRADLSAEPYIGIAIAMPSIATALLACSTARHTSAFLRPIRVDGRLPP